MLFQTRSQRYLFVYFLIRRSRHEVETHSLLDLVQTQKSLNNYKSINRMWFKFSQMCKCCSSKGWDREQADDSNCDDVAVLQCEIEGCELARENGDRWKTKHYNLSRVYHDWSTSGLSQTSANNTKHKLEQLDPFQNYTQDGNFNFLVICITR